MSRAKSAIARLLGTTDPEVIKKVGEVVKKQATERDHIEASDATTYKTRPIQVVPKEYDQAKKAEAEAMKRDEAEAKSREERYAILNKGISDIVAMSPEEKDAYYQAYDKALTEESEYQWQKQQEAQAMRSNQLKAQEDYIRGMAELEDFFEQNEKGNNFFSFGNQNNFKGLPLTGNNPRKYRDMLDAIERGKAEGKAKADQEREELRQRMQLLKDNPEAWAESLEKPLQLIGKWLPRDIKTEVDGTPYIERVEGVQKKVYYLDKNGNEHPTRMAMVQANDKIDTQQQYQDIMEFATDPMALQKTMQDVEAEIERLGKERDAAAQKFSSENPFKAILFSAKGTRSLDPWIEGAYGPEAQLISYELEKAFAKLDNLKNIEKKIKSGELPRGGFWNGLNQFGQALSDKVTDRSWGMYDGMGASLTALGKQQAFTKIAKGERLTPEEMQWACIEMAKQYTDATVKSPYIYNITSGVADSAPYIKDMMLSPGKGISSAFTQWGIKRFGMAGFSKLVGNILQASAMTATVGADDLVAGTIDRMAGNLQVGDNGLEVVEQESAGKAFAKQYASQTTSNVVELMGVPIIGKATKVVKGVGKEIADALTYGKASKALSAMDKSSAVNWVNGVRKSMGIHELPEEIGEEYFEGLAQSVVESEDQFSQMLTTEEALNIVGTCGLMTGIFGVAKVGGFATEYHKVNREYKKAKKNVEQQFSAETWASLDNLITNTIDEDLTTNLATAVDGLTLNEEQKQSLLEYLFALKKYQKFNELNDGGTFSFKAKSQEQAQAQDKADYVIGEDLQLKDEVGNAVDATIVGIDEQGRYIVESAKPVNGSSVQAMSANDLKANLMPVVDGVQQAEVEGMEMTDPTQQAEVSMLADNSREEVATLLGVTPDAVDATLQQVLGDNPTDAKIEARFGNSADVVKDYVHNVAKVKGMTTRVMDDITDAIEESDKAIDAVDNNGNVVTAKDANGNDVNVISGNIVTYEDGLIDTNNSDASVVIRHADGTTEMVTPTSLTEVVSMPTEQAKATQAQAIAQQMQQAFSDRLNGVLDYSQGQQYTMLNADGSTTDVTILADNGDGNVTVTARDGNKEGGVTDGKQIVLPKSQIQQGVREFKRNQLRAESAQQTSTPQAEVQPTEVAEPTQEPTMPTDEQGNIMYEQMDADSAWDALLAETGGDADMAMTVANEMIADKTKAVEKASKMVAQPGATPQEKIANLKAVKQAQAQAQAELDAWKAIAETPNRRMSIAEEATTESVVESTPTESESTPQVGLVEDARTRTLGDKTRKMLDAMAKRLGLQVEFVDEIVTGKDEKGRNLYANAVIVGKNVKIAWHNRNRAIDFLLGHEFTHRMQDLSPEAYAEFVEATKQALGEEELNKRINRMRDIYKSQGKTISEQGIIDEVVADYAGELVEERGVFDNFVERNKENRGLLSKIADVLRSVKEFFTVGKQRKINNAIARLEALIESASEANLRGDVINMEQERYSVSSIFEGTGAIVFNEEGGANIDKDGNFYVIINGKQYDGNNLITLDDIKADKRSVLNLMVEDAIKEGNVTEEHADVIMKKYVDIMNMFLVEGLAENGGYANMADKWMWVGETVYKTVQPNSDKQYTKSIDITTVCKKNEAVIRAMSEMQKRVGYGITPAQILDIYIETQQSGYQVPCPVCYVFSRYLRNGKYASGAILGMEQYGEHLPGGSGETWTADQWVAELRRLEEIDEDKANKALYNQASADIVEAETLIDKLGLRLQQSNSEAERKELRKQIEKADARYRAALNIFSQSALTSWIKTFAIQGSNDKGYKMRDDAQYPEDIELFKEHALDLRKAGETQTLFPAIQRLRNSGGSSTGKAVGFESNNALGDVISGIATGNNDTAYARASKATTEKEFETNRKKATENFKKASEYIKQQTLRGGQRMWSWSDNIEALMPDVVINLMQLELLGGALQTYSKQLEGVNLVARMGGYVNGSLMAKDNGYTEVTEDMIKVEDGKEVLAEDITETIQEPIVGRGIVDRTRVLAQVGSPVIEVDGKKYVLIFDDVIGIDPHGREVDGVHMKGLFDLNKELSKAGNIIVGMNDTHIRVGLADSRIYFIIPWHASGANNHILTEMFRVLGADISSMVSTDYTDMQSEKDYLKEKKDGSMPKIEQSVRDIWNAHKNETDWKCGIKGGIDSTKETISDSQKHYRELRQAIFDGELINNKAWLREVQADEFLSQVYDRVQSGTIGNSMTQEDNNHIYPYEYWDTSKTYDEADINGERYIEYCRRLGFSPKFSGIHGKKEYKNTGNFTNDKGYWKLLVDRRMYDIHDKFQDLDPVTSEDYTNELVHPGNTNKEFVISEVADAKATNKIVDRVIDKETSRTGTMPTVDYTLSHQKAYDNYKKEFDVMMADKAYVKANDAVSQAQAKLDALVEEGATPSRIKNATEKLRKAQEALQQAKKAATSAEKKAQKSRFSLTNLTEEQSIVDEAKANGTYMKAPNGKASNLNERQWIQVRTKAFKDWFGDWENDPENASKVVDENGEPMVVYHGTWKSRGENYDLWNPKNGAPFYTFNADSHFGTEEQAETIINSKRRRMEEYDNDYSGFSWTYPVFLNIRNIKEVYDANLKWNPIIKEAKGEGYDGLSYENEHEGHGMSYIAFEPTQIKSATDNVGTFDASNPDIRYSLFGGNSGYVGYSMSKRAARAREEGRYPKTDFRKEYGVTAKSFDELVDAKIIRSGEWHHTSKFGNETKFYGWDEDYYADIYEENKAVIDKLSRERKTDVIVSLFENHPLAHKAEYDNETERLVDDVNREYNDKIREVENEKRDKERAYNSAVFDALGQLTNVVKANNGNLWFNASNGVGIQIDRAGNEVSMNYGGANGSKGALRYEARNELQTAIESVAKESNIESADATYYTDKVNQLEAERAERVAQLVEAREKEYTTEQTDSEGDYGGERYSLVTDPATIEMLESAPKVSDSGVKLYRAMVEIDGKLYPPMSSMVDEDGKKVLREGVVEGDWVMSDEDLSKAILKEGKDGYGYYFRLLKDDGTYVDARYNPYLHTSDSMLNDQFKSAQSRPNLVVVEMEIPITGDYKAEGAKDAVGFVPGGWKSGDVASQLPSTRNVYLSQYGKVSRIVPTEEVAQHIYDRINGYVDVMPSNVVTPQVREALEMMGVQFVETDNQSVILDGRHKGKSWTQAYGKETIRKREEKSAKANAWVETTKQRLANAEAGLQKAKDNVAMLEQTEAEGMIGKAVGSAIEKAKEKVAKAEAKVAKAKATHEKAKSKVEPRYASRYSLIGEQGATALDKAEEATHRMDNLAVARDMEADGKDAKAIRMATGWERGADGKWRYEIEDVKLKRVPLHKDENNQIVTTLGEIVDAEELFKAYPQLKELDVVSLHGVNELGQYHGGKIYPFIGLNIKTFKPSTVESLNYRLLVEKEDIFSNEEEMIDFVNKWEEADDKAIENPEFYVLYDYTDSILIHEIQHAIQDFEGFAEGGRSDILGLDTYERLAGEVEARSVEKRRGMTPEQRRETLLSETEDVAREDQIFLMKNGDASRYSLQGGRSIADKYEKKVNTKGKGGAMHLSKFNFMEAWQDEMRALKEVQRIIEQEYGIVLESYEDAYMAENAMSSIAKASWDRYINEVYEPMMRIHDEWIRSGESNESINHYLIAKSGLERNREFTVRDAFRAERASMEEPIRDAYRSAIKDLNEKYKPMELDLLNQYRSGAIDKDTYRNERKNLSDAKKAERKPIDDKYQLDMQDAHNKMTQVEEEYKAKRNALREQLKNGDISYEEFNKLSDEVALKHAKTEEIADYSGLTALAKMHGSKDWQGFAEQMVRDFEAKHSNTDVMWEHINNNTKSAVDYSYKSGVTSKQAKDHLDQMFLWYVPMKGNADVEAEDIYTYVNDKSSSFTPTVARAKGHTKYVSEDVMALIANTMQSAILQGERNKVKQKFLNMVQNYPTDLFSVDNGWVELQGNDWVEVFPDINENDTPEEVRSKIEDFQEKMQELANEGKAKRKSEALSLGVPFRATQNKSEHAISVMRNGEKVTIYVNGNPRVAQAVNGKLKATPAWGLYETWKRWFSASKTSYSPNFIVSNASRDTGHTAMMTFVQRGLKEQLKALGTYIPAYATLVANAVGKKSPNGYKYDQYLEEFVSNGGVTGYSQLYGVDKFKTDNAKRIARLKGAAKALQQGVNVVEAINEVWQNINGIFENSSRFNEYIRSRNRGEDVATSVFNAKNITVNFNKKGGGAVEDSIFHQLAFVGRNWMPFFNPIVQGIYQFLKVGKEHKGRMALACLGFMGGGFLAPILNAMLVGALGGDDEDDYMKQPEWTRRNNFMIYTGDGYAKFALPQMFRELYGIGDILYCAIKGNISAEDAAMQVVSQLRNMFSLEGQSSQKGKEWDALRFLAPDYFGAVVDIETNTNFTGAPLWKETDYNQFDPDYKKAYNNTWSWLVDFSQKVNEWTGGDEYSKGNVNNKYLTNPAVWQRLITEMGGGLTETIGDVYNTAHSLLTGRDIDKSNIPLVKRLYTETNAETLQKWIDREYYSLEGTHKYVKNRMSKLNKSSALDTADKISMMYYDRDYMIYAIYETHSKEIKELRDQAQSAPEDKKAEIQKREYDAKMKVISLIDNFNAIEDKEVETYMANNPMVARLVGKDIIKKVGAKYKELKRNWKEAPYGSTEEGKASAALTAFEKTPEYQYYDSIRMATKALDKKKEEIDTVLLPKNRLKIKAEIDSIDKQLVELRKAYESIGEIKE